MYTEVLHRKNKVLKYFLIMSLVALGVLAAWVVYRHSRTISLFLTRADYEQTINEAARRHNIDPPFLKAVIWQESRFQQNIVGRHGEIGLMQIRPEFGAVSDWETSNKVKVSCRGMLFQPELNIEIGAWYLGRALRRWSGYKYQYELALSEYNAGYNGMKGWVPAGYEGDVMERITIPSTRAYITNIMQKYKEYAEKRRAE